jgi:hypothetical protein
VAAGTTTVLVCEGKRTSPQNGTIKVNLAIEPCTGCSCFTVPAAETRTCAVLKADATFVKNKWKNYSGRSYLPAATGVAVTAFVSNHPSVQSFTPLHFWGPPRSALSLSLTHMILSFFCSFFNTNDVATLRSFSSFTGLPLALQKRPSLVIRNGCQS